jgi:hypothetical protein
LDNGLGIVDKQENYPGVYIATDDGLRPDPRKTEEVRNFSEPKVAKKLTGFLGLSSYYRRFIHHYSKVARPLYELLKKDAVYDWKEPQLPDSERAVSYGPYLTVSRFYETIHYYHRRFRRCRLLYTEPGGNR